MTEINAIPEKQCRKCEISFPATREYFYGHKGRHDGFQDCCKSCHNALVNKWKAENPEKVKADKKKWKEEHPEKVREQDKKWKRENPEKVSASNRQYRAQHIDELRESDRIYSRIYAQEHPEKIRANYLRRRAKAKGAEGHHTEAELKELYVIQGGLCCWCMRLMGNRLIDNDNSRDENFTIDHIRPIQDGGSDYIKNIVLACLSCNCSKNDRIVFER